VSKITSANDCLFNWAEKTYAYLFTPAGFSTTAWTIFNYRYYPGTRVYLGVSSVDNHVYLMGADGVLQDEGPVSFWLPLSGCQ